MGKIVANPGVVNALNSNSEWKSLTPTTGTASMTLPDQTVAKEFVFIARYGTQSAMQYMVFSFPVPNLTGINGWAFTQGYHFGEGSYAFAQTVVNCSTHTANLSSFKVNGTDYTSTSKLYCYYR